MTGPFAPGGRQALLATARADNWWSSKLPPLFAVAFAQMLRHHMAPMDALPAFAAVILALCAVAWHAHVVNDLCDIADDARAGKANRMAGSPPLKRWTLLLALPAAGLLVATSRFVEPTAPAVLLIANFLVFVLYSARPARLKTRRWWGVVADATGAHGLPTAFVLCAMPGGVGTGVPNTLFAASAITCAFAVGLRGIIAHQFADRSGDVLARVRTVGTTLSPSTARSLIARVIVPIEAIALVLLVGCTVPFAPMLVLAAFVFVAVEVTKVRRGWTFTLVETDGSTERYLPLVNNDAYELWLPATLALQLASESFAFGLLPLVQVALFRTALRLRAQAIAALWQSEFDPRRFLVSRHGLLAIPHAEELAESATPVAFGAGSERVVAAPPLPADVTIIVGSPNWARNGVNVHSLKLVRGLRRRGVKACILVTEADTELVTVHQPLLDATPDDTVDLLAVSRTQGWGAHWGATIRYLEEHRPCIYLPTYDWRHACVVPRLSNGVMVVGSVTSGDALSEEQAHRLGPWWNALVTSDIASADSFRAADMSAAAALTVNNAVVGASIADRLVVIPDGPEIPDRLTIEPLANASRGELLVCAGTLDGMEADLNGVLTAMSESLGDARVVLVGSADHPELAIPEISGITRGALRSAAWPVSPALLEGSVAMLSWVTSDHVPAELIEAMGRGCIPFLIDCGGSRHRLFRHGANCFVFKRGDVAGIAAQLSELTRRPELRARMAAAAHRAAHAWFTRFDEALDQYLALFQHVIDDARDGAYVRPVGAMRPPPASVHGADVFPVPLPHVVEGVGCFPTADDFTDFTEEVGAFERPVAPSRSSKEA